MAEFIYNGEQIVKVGDPINFDESVLKKISEENEDEKMEDDG